MKDLFKNVSVTILTAIAIIGLAAVLIVSAVDANAAETSIDIEGMSVEEMVKLRDELNAKIAENGGDNVITEGDYVVGTDIKASNFKVTGHGESFVMFTVVSSENYNGDDTNTDGARYMILYDGESGTLNLKEGEVLMVTAGSDYAVIEEVKANFAP